MIQQIEIFEMSRQTGLRRKPSGSLVTAAPLAYAPSPINGDAQICKHTSSGLSIKENADPDVRADNGHEPAVIIPLGYADERLRVLALQASKGRAGDGTSGIAAKEKKRKSIEEIVK